MWIEHMTFRYTDRCIGMKWKLQSDALPTELNPLVGICHGGLDRFHDRAGDGTGSLHRVPCVSQEAAYSFFYDGCE